MAKAVTPICFSHSSRITAQLTIPNRSKQCNPMNFALQVALLGADDCMDERRITIPINTPWISKTITELNECIIRCITSGLGEAIIIV